MTAKIIKAAAKCLLVCTCMLHAQGTWAQDDNYTPLSGDLNFLAARITELFTTNVLDHGSMKDWDSKSLHAGLQRISLNLFNCKPIQKNIPLPDDPKSICKIKDLDGNVVAIHEYSLDAVFKKMQFSNRVNTYVKSNLLVKRGGKYIVTSEITPGLYYSETEITLPDEPCIHVFNKTSYVDTLLCPTIFLSGGYPYDAADFTGTKHLHWQIATADAPDVVIKEKDEIFELKSESADLAPVDSMRLDVENLRPGIYLYTLTSDFAPANYSFTFDVYDILAPDITFDKEVYTVGESREAIVKVDMSYGYPYVGADSSFGEPTVTVCADLLGEETSVSYSDEAWADSDMHCIAEVKVPLEKVTAEAIKENKGELPLQLSIQFNGTTKYETAISLHFESGSSGIDGINADKSDKSKVRYFNILGVEVDESYRGFVISSDGRKLIW